MIISEVAVQAPFVTVHLMVVELPMVRPVTPDVALEGVVAVPEPEKVDHVPVPVAANVVEVTLHKA
jgi:hypothetical protein